MAGTTLNKMVDHMKTGYGLDGLHVGRASGMPHNFSQSTISYDVSDLQADSQKLAEHALNLWADVADIAFTAAPNLPDTRYTG